MNFCVLRRGGYWVYPLSFETIAGYEAPCHWRLPEKHLFNLFQNELGQGHYAALLNYLLMARCYTIHLVLSLESQSSVCD